MKQKSVKHYRERARSADSRGSIKQSTNYKQTEELLAVVKENTVLLAGKFRTAFSSTEMSGNRLIGLLFSSETIGIAVFAALRLRVHFAEQDYRMSPH
jgi:hypothetical protein